MTTTTNLNELAQQIHANAVAKGFWDEPRNTGEILMLIVSELSEALEAHRMGRRASIEAYELYKPFSGFDAEMFKKHIKDTFEDEIADVVIRILDWCSFAEISIEVGLYEQHSDFDLGENPNIGETLLEITAWICRARRDVSISQEACLNAAIIICFNLASAQGFDLEKHIELKMKYNATRERLHGKKY